MRYSPNQSRSQTTLNYNGRPLNPLPFQLSIDRLSLVAPELTGLSGAIHQLFVRLGKQQDDLGVIRIALTSGEPAPAIIICVAPLRVALRATALDCVVILDFPTRLVADYQLTVGSRLLAVNNYIAHPLVEEDLSPGPRRNPVWGHIFPLVADFLCDEVSAIQQYKSAIPEPEWQALYLAGQRLAHETQWKRYRDGRPHLSNAPLVDALEYAASHRSAQRARKILLAALAALIIVPIISYAGISRLLSRHSNAPVVAQPSASPTSTPPPTSLPDSQKPAVPQTGTLPANEKLASSPASSTRPSAGVRVRSSGSSSPDSRPQTTTPPTLPEPSPVAAPPPDSPPSPGIRDDRDRLRQTIDEMRRDIARRRKRRQLESFPVDKAEGAPVTAETPLQKGDKVMAFAGGKWWYATVMSLYGTKVIVSFDSLPMVMDVRREDLRLLSQTGESNEATSTNSPDG